MKTESNPRDVAIPGGLEVHALRGMKIFDALETIDRSSRSREIVKVNRAAKYSVNAERQLPPRQAKGSSAAPNYPTGRYFTSDSCESIDVV